MAKSKRKRAPKTALKLPDLEQWKANVRGKGGHIRTISVPEWVKEAVDQWTLSADINSGRPFRSINKAGRIGGHGFTPTVIWAIVKANAKSCGLPR